MAFEKSNKGAGSADTWGRESPQRAGEGRGRAGVAGGQGSSLEAGVAGVGRGAASHARGLQSQPRARLTFEKPLSFTLRWEPLEGFKCEKVTQATM